jgi:hypothetical protein
MTTRYRLALIGFGLLLSVVAAATASPSGSPFAWPAGDRDPNLADVAASGDPIPTAEARSAWGAEDSTVTRPTQAERVRGSFIVELAPGLDPHQVGPELAAQYGGEAALIYDEVIGGFAFKGPDDVREDLARDPRVVGVEDDDVVYPLSHRPELGSMGATDAWNITPADPRYRGAGAVVAIIDSGLQVTNPNIGDGDETVGEPGDSVLGLHNCTSGQVIDDAANHGTWVFGTALGDEGVLPEGKGYHIKIGKSTASESAMVCGLNKVKQWINEGKTIHSANLSWGCEECTLSSVRKAIGELRVMGVPVMVAAGNNGAAVEAPARFPESVAVSATDVTNTRLASFSARGPEVDIGAPGDGISVLSSSGCCWIGRGTSFAAPHAAAGGALLKSLYPALSVDDLVTTMQRKGFVRSGLVEPALNVGGIARGPDWSPTGSFVGLAGGQQVAGTVTLRVQAADDHPLPANAVAIKAGSGSFVTAPLVGSNYERSWNTCPSNPCPDPTAPVRVEAKITDSIGQSTTVPIDLIVDNVDDPPSVSFVSPVAGSQTAQAFQVRVAATDDNAVSSVELFVDDVSKGTRSSPASGNEFAWSLTNISIGSRVLRAVATDGVNPGAQSSITVQARDRLYQQGFDGAAGDASDLSHWTVTGKTPLWHVSSSCGAASSAPRGFYYGLDSGCHYSNGSVNDGYLTSPTIGGLPSSYKLTFRSKERVESSCSGGSCTSRDVRTVEVNYGQGWQNIYNASAATGPGTGDWVTRSFSLGSSSGSLQIRFRFATGSKKANEFFGWAVDDIVLAP